jgi:hypothetical protein
MEHILGNIETRKFPHYKAVFTFEADCVPLQANWLSHFRREWALAQTKKAVYTMGVLLKYPGWHINGNALFSTDISFLRWITKDIVSASPSQGWDYWIAEDLKQWGVAEMPGMRSYWNLKTLPEEAIETLWAEKVVWMHGIKDGSLLGAAKKRLGF